MRHTPMKKATSFAAWLSPVLAAATLFAHDRHPPATTGSNLEFPFQVVGENCPADDDEIGAAEADADNPADDAEIAPADSDAPRPAASAAVDFAPQDMETEAGTETATESVAADDITPLGTAHDLSPRMEALRTRVREALAFYHRKQLNTRDHNPWEVMHSIVAYGVDSQLHRNGPEGQTVNAISWLCWNGDCKGTRILEVTGNRLAARKGPQVQGHPGQLLAILAQSNVDISAPIKVGDKRFTLEDLIESEKLGCQAGTELTFKLISLSHYLDSDARWKSSDGQNWSIERLVREELSQPIIGAACGGSHRLMGFAYAVRNREMAGKPISGEFRRAKKYLDDYHTYALTKLQNSDGSFSTEWFKTAGARPDLGRRIQTSGHILEWLSYSLPLERLEEPRVVKAVEYLTDTLLDNRNREWAIGPLGHAMHSLAIYDSRVFRPLDEAESGLVGTDVAEPSAIEEDRPAKIQPAPARAPQRAAPRVTRRDVRPQQLPTQQPRGPQSRPSVRRVQPTRP